jgi:hypothetical protein
VVGNIVQSDGITADVSFSVAQSRNNGSFLCGGNSGEPPPPPTTSTLFSEDFNKCSNSHDNDYEHSWHKKWDKKGGENDDDKSCTKVADLDASSQNHTESLSTPNINTTGYHTIVLKYDRKTDDVSGPVDPQTLTVEYSVNGGGSWTTLETVVGETPWTTKTWSLSPSANNKTQVKVRFTLVGTNGTNHAYVDNITITGITP